MCEKDFKVIIVPVIFIFICFCQAIGHSCSVCDQVITGQVYVIDEAFLCEADFEVKNINGVHFVVTKGSFQALSSGKPCMGCGQDVYPDDSLSVGNVLFHHACLTCQICHKNMEGKSVSLDNKNRVYCTEDYTR